ncbi:MAG: type VI secretion system tube protein Hcp [Sphingomicrobium sp.]
MKRLPGKRTPPTVTLKRGMTGNTDGDPDRPLIAGTLPNASPAGANETITVGGGRTESGQATGKRTHMPLRARAYLDQGSISVQARMPGCKVGASFPHATLETPTMRYEMWNIMISSCGTSTSGASLPLEVISFNYGKIQTTPVRSKVQVKGWDPTTKKE